MVVKQKGFAWIPDVEIIGTFARFAITLLTADKEIPCCSHDVGSRSP